MLTGSLPLHSSALGYPKSIIAGLSLESASSELPNAVRQWPRHADLAKSVTKSGLFLSSFANTLLLSLKKPTLLAPSSGTDGSYFSNAIRHPQSQSGKNSRSE